MILVGEKERIGEFWLLGFLLGFIVRFTKLVCTTSLLPATTTSSTIFSTPMLDSDRHRDLPSLNLNLNGLGTTYGQLKEPE